MLTKGMAIDWGKHGLRVNGLGPGYFRTELNEALVDGREILRLARRPDADRPLGRRRGTGRRRDLPRLRRLELRQWPHPLCRRRDHRLPLSRLAIVVMGVSGAGKTTVGLATREALGADFFDGDDLHIRRRAPRWPSGIAPDRRRPLALARPRRRPARRGREPPSAIVACSALRRAYRDRLRAAAGPKLRFIYLAGDPQMMRARVAGRRGHYMPASLVDSQFAALEPPEGESDVVAAPADGDLDREIPAIVARICRRDR